MKVSFLIPANLLSGGHRIIYELSNRLRARGHVVTIYCPVLPAAFTWNLNGFSIRGVVGSVLKQVMASRPDWIALCVPLLRIPWVSPAWMSDADVLVVTHWDVALATRHFSERLGRKVYYIHDSYRSFGPISELVKQTWQQPFQRVVTTRRLKNEAGSLRLEAEYVPNAICTSAFKMSIPSEKRDPLCIAMCYSNASQKGAEDGFAVLKRVHEIRPGIRVLLFGTAKLKKPVESWIIWKGQVSHQELIEIYNEASIFLCTSRYEGWGLPGFEAMACGCALVSTHHDGVREYAEHGKSALLAPVGDVETLARHIGMLISDDTLRIHIAKNGMESVQRFTWERTVDLFEQSLLRVVNGG